MRVKLLRDARINHKAGEIVDVSPSEFQFLVSVGSAVEVAVKPLKKAETAVNIEKSEEKKSKKK